MIKINLLPEELRRQRVTDKGGRPAAYKITAENQAKIKLIAVVAVLLYVFLHILAAGTLFLKKNSLNRLSQRLTDLEPKYMSAQSLKSDMLRLKGRLSAINELTSKSILWSKETG